MYSEEHVQIIGNTTQELLTKLRIVAHVAVQPLKDDEEMPTETTDGNDKTSYMVEVSGDNLGVLIGYHGETLNNFQTLLSLIVNKKINNTARIIVDIDNWRKERQETIENIVRNTIAKVRATKREQVLPPLTAYERRLVHKFVGNEHDVVSYSRGEGIHRSAFIAPRSDK